MEIQLTPEQETQFSQLADEEGRDKAELIHEALSRYLVDEARFIAAVKKGFDSLDRGDYVSHEEVGARIEELLTGITPAAMREAFDWGEDAGRDLR